MASRGRKAKVNCDTYLGAVEAKKSLDDKVIADYLGVNRSNVYRFRTNEDNAECVALAEALINEVDSISFEKQVSYDVYLNIPEIKEWDKLMIARECSAKLMKSRKKNFYNVCVHLKTHPAKLDPDRVADFVVEQKLKYQQGIKAQKGLYYTSIRDPIRSFFMLVKGVSGEYMGSRGVDMGETKGAGQFAHISVSRTQRNKLERTLVEVIDKFRTPYVQENKAMIHLELLTMCKFMYYTGSRKQATLDAYFNNPKSKYNDQFYGIHITDKGRKGGYEWVKLLQYHALEDFQNYVYIRFGIPEHEQIDMLPELDSLLFPHLVEVGRGQTDILGRALKLAGNSHGYPNHIWRHTFAQEFLKATEYNYELTASVGGWKSTKILKKHYGEMTEDARFKGLSQAMGVTIEEEQEPAILRW